MCDEKEFAALAEELARSLPAPTDGGKEIRFASYKRKIKRALRRTDAECSDTELRRLFLTLSDRKEELKS